MIVISGTIGVGFFVNTGEILAMAGPAAAILAVGIVGILSCVVMESISEMLIVWPVPNPMVEFVRSFVDRDLAVVVGIAYWCVYTCTHIFAPYLYFVLLIYVMQVLPELSLD